MPVINETKQMVIENN